MWHNLTWNTFFVFIVQMTMNYNITFYCLFLERRKKNSIYIIIAVYICLLRWLNGYYHQPPLNMLFSVKTNCVIFDEKCQVQIVRKIARFKKCFNSLPLSIIKILTFHWILANFLKILMCVSYITET